MESSLARKHFEISLLGFVSPLSLVFKVKIISYKLFNVFCLLDHCTLSVRVKLHVSIFA